MSDHYTFVKGSDVTITVNLIDKATKAPYQITGFTSATLYIKKNDSTYHAASGTLVSSDLGKLQFIISDTDSALLKAGSKLDVQLTLIQGTTKTNFIITDGFSILENLA